MTLIVCFVCMSGSSAEANAPVQAFSITPSTTQAVVTRTSQRNMNWAHVTTSTSRLPVFNCQDAKDVSVDAPTGVIADPHATPQRTIAEFGTHTGPVDSQVGTTTVVATPFTFHEPVYNLIPHPGEGGLLGINIGPVSFPIFIAVNPRTQSDYGLNSDYRRYNATPLNHQSLSPLGSAGGPQSRRPATPPPAVIPLVPALSCITPTPSDPSPTPFLLHNPRRRVPLSATIHVLAYDDGTSQGETPYPATTGCEQLSSIDCLPSRPQKKLTLHRVSP